MEDDSPSNQAKIGQLVRRKEGWIWILGNQISLFSAPRPNLLRYTSKTETKIKIKIKMMNRSMSEAPSQPILVIDSHPLDGWFGLAKDCGITIIGKGVRHSDFKQKRP